jgi:hypothetical protein
MIVNKSDDFEELISNISEVLLQLILLDEEDVKHHLDHLEIFVEVLYSPVEETTP